MERTKGSSAWKKALGAASVLMALLYILAILAADAGQSLSRLAQTNPLRAAPLILNLLAALATIVYAFLFLRKRESNVISTVYAVILTASHAAATLLLSLDSGGALRQWDSMTYQISLSPFSFAYLALTSLLLGTLLLAFRNTRAGLPLLAVCVLLLACTGVFCAIAIQSYNSGGISVFFRTFFWTAALNQPNPALQKLTGILPFLLSVICGTAMLAWQCIEGVIKQGERSRPVA